QFVARITEGFSRFVTSTTAPVASGGSTSPGGACTRWNYIALSRRTPGAAIRGMMFLLHSGHRVAAGAADRCDGTQ
ncbi:MAG TPA: hypothetical protein VEC35_21175, partial [Noviherbaspirillum sp.]|nr:hypothetical protein [Noviherbaspirillum sp.]